MNRNELVIIAAVAALAILILCSAGGFAVYRINARAVQLANMPAIEPPPSPTASTTPTLTSTATPNATNTWVVQRNAPRTATRPAPPPGTPGPLQNALAQDRAVQSYRFEFKLDASGDLGLPANPGPNQAVSILEMTGEFNGSDSHLKMKGLSAIFLGIDVKQGIEFVASGGRLYIHGPLAVLGALEDQWYVVTGDRGDILQQTPGRDEFLDMWGAGNASLYAFVKTGDDKLDNRSCQVFRGDRDATMGLFGALEGGGLSPATDLSVFDTAETRFWVCDDGHLHQMKMTLGGYARSYGQTRAQLALSMHLYDHNSAIKIVAPVSVIPLQIPQYIIPKRTPTPYRFEWKTPTPFHL